MESRIYILPSLTDVLEFGIQAFLYLAMAAYCLVKVRKGAWAVAGLMGALAGALPLLVFTYSLVRLKWANDSRFADALDSGRFLSHLHWARLLSVLLLGLALVLATRRRNHPERALCDHDATEDGDSIVGPEE